MFQIVWAFLFSYPRTTFEVGMNWTCAHSLEAQQGCKTSCTYEGCRVLCQVENETVSSK